jgi:ubiquinone/menaquinone biosynthesis C-methylase UbiE
MKNWYDGFVQRYVGLKARSYDKSRFGNVKKAIVDKKEKETILKILQQKKIKRILDVACGTGRIQIYLKRKGYKVVGMDFSVDMLSILKSKERGALVVRGDAKTLPFKDEFFDCLVSFHFVRHLPNYLEILKEMKRVVKKNGYIILDFPNRKSVTGYVTRMRQFIGKIGHCNLLTKSNIYSISHMLNLTIEDLFPIFFISPIWTPLRYIKIVEGIERKLMQKNIFIGFGYIFVVCFKK